MKTHRSTGPHNLVRTGPYRFIRNPMYSGVILALNGSAISSNQVFMLLILIIVPLGIWIKLKDEEQLLLREFGDEYDRYMRETKALIPYILSSLFSTSPGLTESLDYRLNRDQPEES